MAETKGPRWHWVIAIAVVVVFSVFVAVAMRAALGWRGLARGTAVYTLVVLAMATLALLVIVLIRGI